MPRAISAPGQRSVAVALGANPAGITDPFFPVPLASNLRCLIVSGFAKVVLMKFLKSWLWVCVASVGFSPVRAQDMPTPEQQKQAEEALRKALG